MFGDKLSNANAKITALVALIGATGFKIDAATILDPKTEASALPTADAFKAHLTEQGKSATLAAVEAATAPLNTRIGVLVVEEAHAVAFRAGIEAAGVKLAGFVTADQAAGDSPEAKAKAAASANAVTVQMAIETAISAKAAKQVAATGHGHALELTPGAEEQKSANEPGTPANAEEFKTNLQGIKDPGARTAYFRKHKAKFGL